MNVVPILDEMVELQNIIIYTCLCRRGYGGRQCQYRRARLRIYAHYGCNLPDEDPWLNDSDPYLKAVAYRSTGNSVSKKTRADKGDESPEWYQWLDFGYSEWNRFYCSNLDGDVNSDDACTVCSSNVSSMLRLS